ncbi:MAG: type IV secretory system conjugative DNA transfer family protein [Faecalibacterium sp.]|nr:type IV secretory system conjugative DNA transfer family protein [Ruminococcus sp.]MCM1392061.1 type IV secretory system conjugative DNA transfer family protein [Ruminococcus sp.]MCM1486664.1 type IV secretory system conjugative DNA transfer family protein [Faecalibacterium sp.]
MKTSIASASYSEYIHKPPKTNWTDRADLQKRLSFVDFTKGSALKSGGIPIISDGNTAYIDTSDNHCAIMGNSGGKKSICCFMPTIYTLAKANENMVCLDPKGELYKRTGNLLKSRGYRVITLDFRDFNGDGYNPLHYPAKIWRSGDKDKASIVASDFLSTISQRQTSVKTVDPFWADTATAYCNGVLAVMFDCYKNIDDINVISLADYFTESTSNYMKEILPNMIQESSVVTNLKTVLSEPDKTRMCSLTTAASYIQPFIQNDKLARMLMRSTFELEDIIEEKTAMFLITDDSTTVCNAIVGVLISQLQTVLLDKAYHCPGGRLPNRVNFLLDEFCSFPIPNICEALATHRSRNIRYYLCIQTIDALEERYPHYESLISNCATTLFLSSTEMRMLDMISKRCGTTKRTESGNDELLISPAELMTLKKSWDSKEALYLNLSEAVRYCATLPAIEQYYGFSRFIPCEHPSIEHPKITFCSIEQIFQDIRKGKIRSEFFTPV